MVEDVIEAEVIPGALGQQGVDFDHLIRAWAQADEPGDDEVIVGGVVVVFAAVVAAFALGPVGIRLGPVMQAGAGDPVAGVGVDVFIDPGNDLAILTLELVGAGVALESLKVGVLTDDVLLVVVEQVGEGGEHTAGSQRPAGAVPLAFVPFIGKHKTGMALLGEGGAEFCVETLGVHELFPAGLVAWVGQVEVPGGVAVELAHVDKLAMVLLFLGRRGLVIEGGEGAGEFVGVGGRGLGSGGNALLVGKKHATRECQQRIRVWFWHSGGWRWW